MAGAVFWGGQRTGSQVAVMCCAAGDVLPAAGYPQPQVVPSRDGGGPGRAGCSPAVCSPNRLGPQCPGNATSKMQSWYLWGTSKEALLAPVLPLASRELQQGEDLQALPWGWRGSINSGGSALLETCIFQPCHAQQHPSGSQGVPGAQPIVGREHNLP